MKAMDQITKVHGRESLMIGCVPTRKWKPRDTHRTPRYTTHWKELVKVI